MLDYSKLVANLEKRDLTNPIHGDHAMQILLKKIISSVLEFAPCNKPVSKMPASSKDISIAVDKDVREEEIGAIIYETFPEYIDSIEEVKILSETPYEKLPTSAIKRMGLNSNQKNLLVRIVIRNLSKTLTIEEAKIIRNAIYKKLHQGTNSEGDYNA